MAPLLTEITVPVGSWKEGQAPLPCGESWHRSPTAACKCFWKAGPPSFRQPWLRLPGKAGLKLGLQGVGANIPGHTCDSSCEAGALLPVGRGTGVSWAPKRPGLGGPGCLGREAAQSFLLGEKRRGPPAGGGVGARERPQGVREGLQWSSTWQPRSHRPASRWACAWHFPCIFPKSGLGTGSSPSRLPRCVTLGQSLSFAEPPLPYMTLWGCCLSETGQLVSVPGQALQVAWRCCSRAWVWGVRPCGYERAAL